MIDTDSQIQLEKNNEIDLRELIYTLYRGKWIVFSITLVFLLVGGIMNFFIIKPTYESTAVIGLSSISNLNSPKELGYIVTDSNAQNFIDKNRVAYNMDQIVTVAQMDVNGFKEIVTSNYTLESTIKTLSLNDSVSALRRKIKVEANKNDSKVLQIVVSDRDPQNAAILANTLISESSNKINEINNDKISSLYNNLDNLLKSAQQDLAVAFNDLKEYKIRTANQQNTISNEIEQKKLEDEIRRRQAMVDSLGTKILEVKVAKSLNTSEDKIIILSPAIPSTIPVSPDKPMGLLLYGVVGLLISIFIVFLRNYLRKDHSLT